MKRIAVAILCLAFAAASLTAQVPSDMTPEQLEAAKAAYAAGKSPAEIQAAIAAAAPAAPAASPPPPHAKPSVSTPMGELSIDGRVIVGASASWTHQYGEDFSALSGINPQMEENRAELSFHLKNGNFGEFIMLRAQLFGPNNNYYDGNYNPENNTLNPKGYGYNSGGGFNITPAYFFVYGAFLDDFLKVSVGKLYDENYMTRERVWKTEGATNGGLYFSREGYLSARIEFMPVQGLDIGGQLFFVNSNTRYVMKLMGLDSTPVIANASVEEFLKEWGLGASYTSAPFNAQLGVRLDSAVDPMNKYESKTYLYEYYGDGSYMDPNSTNAYAQYHPLAPHYKHSDKLVDASVDMETYATSTVPKMFADGMYGFAGFNLKAVKNLTFKVQAQFNNIPAFNEFGYGVVDETIGYQILPKLYVGIVMYQEFYGGDVFDTDKYANSPYFRFTPSVSYQLTSTIRVSPEIEIGLCQDVLETPHIAVKVPFDITLAAFGAWRAQAYYKYSQTDYKDYKGIDYDKLDFHSHTIGIGLDFIF
ncbi:MAG: hypothetical protein LBF60_05450 [Treponema sp.]|jgi:hypothetical protein|nr:hypothetical protein [Treponema sp.]